MTPERLDNLTFPVTPERLDNLTFPRNARTDKPLTCLSRTSTIPNPVAFLLKEPPRLHSTCECIAKFNSFEYLPSLRPSVETHRYSPELDPFPPMLPIYLYSTYLYPKLSCFATASLSSPSQSRDPNAINAAASSLNFTLSHFITN